MRHRGHLVRRQPGFVVGLLTFHPPGNTAISGSITRACTGALTLVTHSLSSFLGVPVHSGLPQLLELALAAPVPMIFPNLDRVV